MTEEDRIKEVELYAWVGEDELGSGEIGLKQALTRVGCIPLVATKKAKMYTNHIPEQLQAQVKQCGKTIRLVRFTFAEIVDVIPAKVN